MTRSKPCRLHNPSSQQQLSSVVAAAAQPDRLGHVPPPQQLASGNEALQVYAELQQQQQAAQQDDSSWQQLVVQASGKLPNQADQLWGDPSDRESRDVALVEPAKSSYADLDYLSVGFGIPLGLALIYLSCVLIQSAAVVAWVHVC